MGVKTMLSLRWNCTRLGSTPINLRPGFKAVCPGLDVSLQSRVNFLETHVFKFGLITMKKNLQNQEGPAH